MTDKTEPLNTNKLRDHVEHLANNVWGLTIEEWGKVSNDILQAAYELDDTRTELDAERAARIKAEAELKELREVGNALVDLHNGPTERKRPDVFQRLMSRLARAVGK